MNKREKIILAVTILAVVAALGAVVYATFFYGSDYQKALASENTDNICATPSGYTDASWKDHMSHHPDRYAECLK
ncbi:MAG: hypothetical protein HZB65_01610 [Candidatus Aenigmarchaeota archaeon]|nr:hypothetical protein [Candidatus Aenigmarchaeota archaeon]